MQTPVARSLTLIKNNYRVHYGTPHYLASLLRLNWALAIISTLELDLGYSHDTFPTIHRIPFRLGKELHFSWDIMRARSRLKFTFLSLRLILRPNYPPTWIVRFGIARLAGG